MQILYKTKQAQFLYKAYVRNRIDCSVAWSPVYNIYIDEVERGRSSFDLTGKELITMTDHEENRSTLFFAK